MEPINLTQLTTRRYRLATGQYMHTRVLTWRLEDEYPVQSLDALSPRELRGKLSTGQVDAALLSPLDLQQIERPVTVLTAGCVAASGRCMSVRVFSHVPPPLVTVLWVDADAPMATALASLLWADSYDTHLRIIPFRPDRQDVPPDAEAVLLCGDRVLSDAPIGFDWHTDLGSMWFETTGLPLVLSVWSVLDPDTCGELYPLLHAARHRGQDACPEIVERYAAAYGWPKDLADRYLIGRLQFEFRDEHREGLEEFFHRAADLNIIDSVRPLDYWWG